jgi:hypothetical protein
LLPALEVAPISQRRRAFEETARRPGPRRYRHYGGMDGRAAVNGAVGWLIGTILKVKLGG